MHDDESIDPEFGLYVPRLQAISCVCPIEST